MTTIGSYEVVRLIHEGNYGRTYEAMHLLLDEKACLKQNINLTVGDAELLKNEAKLLWNIHHHSLPSVRDFFEAEDGSYVIAMSFIEGETIDDIVRREGRIEPEKLCWITQRLLNALHYLHSKGIVHCDVKPTNIIVQENEHNAWLVDYGFAALNPVRSSKSTGYTEVFSAPEVVDGKPPVPESDLYSLGLTMIYALGGNPSTRTLPRSIPRQLHEFCNELVSLNPADRPGWERQDLVARLSGIRQEVFGRKISLEKAIK